MRKKKSSRTFYEGRMRLSVTFALKWEKRKRRIESSGGAKKAITLIGELAAGHNHRGLAAKKKKNLERSA